MADPPVVRPARRRNSTGSSAKSLLLTVLGEFVLPNGGSAWTNSVIRMLEPVSVNEPNARQAIARLGDDGVVFSTRAGRATKWELTPAGDILLREGARRIYEFGANTAGWDGRWLVAVTAVPEEMRAKRQQVKRQLGFAGFGFLTPGVAVSPHTKRLEAASALLNALGLEPAPILFIAEATAIVPEGEIIRRAWDLEHLESRYAAFISDFGRSRPKGGPATFASLVRLVHEWRKFPFDDPEIPAELLPAKWPGRRAKDVFDHQRASWSPTAQRWYHAVE
jgi:phenylacetic acid degradation operon negative regulatory protein